jgi:hypothetical protein
MIWLMTMILALHAEAAPPPAKRAKAAADTQGVAGGVVRSKQWVVKRGPPRVEEFSGEVSYRKGPSLLNSDWALFQHATQVWQVKGHVQVWHTLKSGDRVEFLGEQGEYNQGTKLGHLLGAADGLVAYKRFPVEGGPPDEGTAVRLDWEGSDKAHLTGSVHVWGPRMELHSAKADYDAGPGTVTAVGNRPVLRILQGDWTGAVQADTMTAKEKPELFWADGKTRGWLKFKDKIAKVAK